MNSKQIIQVISVVLLAFFASVFFFIIKWEEGTYFIAIALGLFCLFFPNKASEFFITTSHPGKEGWNIKNLKEDFGEKTAKWVARLFGIIVLLAGINLLFPIPIVYDIVFLLIGAFIIILVLLFGREIIRLLRNKSQKKTA